MKGSYEKKIMDLVKLPSFLKTEEYSYSLTNCDVEDGDRFQPNAVGGS